MTETIHSSRCSECGQALRSGEWFVINTRSNLWGWLLCEVAGDSTGIAWYEVHTPDGRRRWPIPDCELRVTVGGAGDINHDDPVASGGRLLRRASRLDRQAGD